MTISYELVARDPLPQFDPSVTFKQYLFPPAFEQWYNHVMHTYRHVLPPIYLASVILRLVTIYSPAHIGRVVAGVSLALQTPATSWVMVMFRVEYVRMLLRTYDFWFCWLMNLAWVISIVLLFRDCRLLAIAPMCIEFTNASLIDAFFRDLRKIVIAAWLGIAQLLLLIFAVYFDALDDVNHVEVIKTRFRSLTTRDLILNTSGMSFVLLIRLVYRRREAIRIRRRRRSEAHHRAKMIQVIAYRCKLAMQECNYTSPRTASIVQPLSSHLLAMNLVPTEPIHFQIPPTRRWSRWLSPRYQRLWLWATALLSLTTILATVPAMMDTHLPPQDRSVHYTHPLIPIATTLLFLAQFPRHYSRTLLKRLLLSFDSGMLSIKLTTGHLCVCDLFFWQSRACAVVLCSWLWWHWVLSLDALPPISRQRLGLRLSLAAPVLTLLVLAQLALAAELLFLNHWYLQDRAMFRLRLFGRMTELLVVPFLFSRVLTVLIWTGRLLYRVLRRQSDNELLILAGNVEYEWTSKKHVGLHRIIPLS